MSHSNYTGSVLYREFTWKSNYNNMRLKQSLISPVRTGIVKDLQHSDGK